MEKLFRQLNVKELRYNPLILAHRIPELKFPTTIMETWISELRYPTPVAEQRTLNSWTSNTNCGTWNSDELRYPSANNE